MVTIKYAGMGVIEREFRFLKTMDWLEELHDFCFKHACSFNSVKKRPNFSNLLLACSQSAPSQKGCPYRLLARRTILEHGEIIDVYAHSEHNHTVKPEAKRSSRRGERNVLMPDKNPPPTQLTPDGLEWTFQRTFANFEALTKWRIENRCKRHLLKAASNKCRLYCWHAYDRNSRCPFLMLAWKTTKQRYHVYTHGQHSCPNRRKKQHKRNNGMSIEKRGGKHSKRSREEEKEIEDDEEMGDEKEEDENMEAKQTEEKDGDGQGEEDGPPIVKEYSMEKIQRRLGHSLRKGRAERAHKWMGRLDLEQIDTILTGMDLENVVKLMEMADRELNEDRESRNFWRPWIKGARQNHGPELAKIPNLIDHFSSRYLCRKLAKTIKEEEDGGHNKQ